MSELGHYALQKAIYQQLIGNAGLMALVTGIFDRPAQGTAYPYITIGESAIIDSSNVEVSGTQQTIALHIWSREGGRKQAATIMDKAYAALHQAAMSVDNQTLVAIRFSSSQITLEDDGVTYQGLLNMRALLQAS